MEKYKECRIAFEKIDPPPTDVYWDGSRYTPNNLFNADNIMACDTYQYDYEVFEQGWESCLNYMKEINDDKK